MREVIRQLRLFVAEKLMWCARVVAPDTAEVELDGEWLMLPPGESVAMMVCGDPVGGLSINGERIPAYDPRDNTFH